MNKFMYSVDGEMYSHSGIGDVFDELHGMDELEVGRVFYECEFEKVSPHRWIDVQYILDGADESLYSELGEAYDDGEVFSGVSDEAKAELKSSIDAWIDKHVSPHLGQYFLPTGKAKERTVTEEDVKSFDTPTEI